MSPSKSKGGRLWWLLIGIKSSGCKMLPLSKTYARNEHCLMRARSLSQENKMDTLSVYYTVNFRICMYDIYSKTDFKESKIRFCELYLHVFTCLYMVYVHTCIHAMYIIQVKLLSLKSINRIHAQLNVICLQHISYKHTFMLLFNDCCQKMAFIIL